MSKKNLKQIFLSSMIIFIFLFLTSVTFASDTGLEFKEYSDRYKKWLELPQEERDRTREPIMFESEYTPKSKTFLNTLRASVINGLSSYKPSYTLRENIDITIKNQGQTQQCYAFSVLSSLETNLALKGEILEFSTRHLHYSTSKTFTDGINPSGHNREITMGGNDAISLAYLSRGAGPILESEMKFEEKDTQKPLSYIEDKTAVKKVEEYIFFPNITGETNPQVKNEFRNMIKEHIILYGSVTGGMVIPEGQAEVTEYYAKYYNQANGATYYTGTRGINHEVSIIGWDDDYAVTNFLAANRPQNPGAFIVRNSWGTSWGDGGYQYVSYEDPAIVEGMSGVVKLSNIDYDNIYVNDELGASDGLMSNYGLNVFERQSTAPEKLTEVGLYFFGKTNFEIYVNSTDGTLDDNKFVSVKTGTYQNDGYGYISVKLDTPITLTGNKFAVKVRYAQLDSDPYVPVEYKTVGTLWNTVTAKPGESYIWFNNTWADIGSVPANVCIKAFTTETNTTAPTCTITANPSANPTNASSITYTFTFSEPVTGFDTSKITVTNGTKGAFSGSGAVYTLVVATSANQSNTQTVSVVAGACTNLSGVGNIAASRSVVIDRAAPTCTITSNPNVSTTNASSITYTFTFSKSVTGFDASKVTVTNGTKGAFSGSGAVYTLVVTNTITSGVQTVSIEANACQDSLGNNNTAATKAITIDKESLLPTKYIIGPDQIICGISNETTVQVFKDNVTTSKNIKIFNKNGVQLQNNDIIGTGMKLLLDDAIEYGLVVTGDTTGNGEFTITDLSRMISHRIGEYVLTGLELRALDVNIDGKVTITDLSIMIQYRVESKKF